MNDNSVHAANKDIHCFIYICPRCCVLSNKLTSKSHMWTLTAITHSIVSLHILVPRAYDPSGLRQELRALGTTISGIRHRCGRIRLFPLLFQNGCSQSSRFLPQARRIVGSGDENAFPLDRFTLRRLSVQPKVSLFAG